VDGESAQERTLFAVADALYRWRDVVELARRRGDWARLTEDALEGAAAVRALDAAGETVPREELDEAAKEFRYARDLLAGDELTDWLESRGLTTDDWQDYLLRVRARARIDAPAADGDEPELAWVEGICSGRLEELARELAELVAVSPGAPPDRLEPALEQFCAEAVDDPSCARELEANRLEWLRFGYDAVALAEEHAALELALCVRADGDTLAAAAARAGVTVEEREDWLDEIEPALATRFLAAQPGDLIGPVPSDGSFVVAHVRKKVAPTLDDPDVRARAEEAVVARAVARAVADRVIWHEPL
jgi:hypothetical protein